MTTSTLFQKLPSINDISKYTVHFTSGPILTALVNHNHEKVSLIFINSLIPHIFWTGLFPFTIEKIFMSEQNVWQAHVVGIAAGWLTTYLFVNNFGFTKLPDPTGQSKEQEIKAVAKNTVWSIFTNLNNPGKAIADSISYAFKLNNKNSEAIRSTMMPCLVSTIPHLYRLYKVQFSA